MNNLTAISQSYRQDIDGLRAIAVLGVVLYHAGLGIPGGYVGVDIFFVISGFLITGHIIKDLEKGNFSMLKFWEKRIRRIFPAMAVMVLTCLIAGYFLLLPFGYLVLGQSAIALAAFSSNIQFWRTTGYFTPDAEENPLLHTWSLSVEEQFYLIVPLIIAGLFAWKRKKLLMPSILLGIVLSFILAVYWLRVDPTGAFYLLPSRAWELGMGSLVALAQPLRSQTLRLLLGVGGLSGILATYWLYDSRTLFPGLAALPPVLGSAGMIWSGMRCDDGSTQSPAHRVLAWGPLVWIGLLSYSLYLWHWPFFAFHRYLFNCNPSIQVSVIYLITALLLSVVSLKYIETPFRKRQLFSSTQSIITFYITIKLVIISISSFIYLNKGIPSRVPKKAINYDSVIGNKSFKSTSAKELPSGLCVQKIGFQGSEPQYLIWGDSHVGVLVEMLDSVCSELSLSVITAHMGGRPPLLDKTLYKNYIKGEMKCMLGSEEIQKLISKEKSIKNILLIGHWISYLDNGFVTDKKILTEYFPDYFISTIKTLQKIGLKVTIMREVPVFHQHVARSMALHEWHGFPEPYLSQSEYLNLQNSFDRLHDRIVKEAPGVVFIDPSPYLINESMMFDYIDDDDMLLYFDNHHLTHRGSFKLKPFFWDLFHNGS